MPYTTALKLLALREHSQLELQQKLCRSGFNDNEIAETLAQLIEAGLQSDARYVESYITMRIHRGYGPHYIHQALKARGISSEMISQVMSKCDINWSAQVAAVYHKKFKTPPKDRLEKLKRQRFLQQRGFGVDHILNLRLDDDDE